MTKPLIRQYAQSVMEPYGLLHTLKEFKCLTDRYGDPEMFTGGNAVVFKIMTERGICSMKCYFKPKTGLKERIDYINTTGEQLFEWLEYRPAEIAIYDPTGSYVYHDVVLSRWIEGHSLDYVVRKAVKDNDSNRLQRLSEEFYQLACELLTREWAHGDLKPENIILNNEEKMRLIDCDAMYIPSVKPSGEMGTWMFQHPRRTAQMYDKHLDDYSIAIISASLHALANDMSLYGRYNSKGNLIFNPEDIVGHHCEAFTVVCNDLARRGHAPLLRLLRTLDRPAPAIAGLREMIVSLHSQPIDTDWHQLSAFRQGHLWGYCDTDGKTVIEPLFDWAMEYRDAVAEVGLMDYKHLIGPDGSIISKV